MGYNSMKNFLAFGVSLSLLFASACTTIDPFTGESKTSNTAKGTGIGAALGALGGLIVGDSERSVWTGAGIGALAGAGVGAYQDRQEQILRQELQQTGVSVSRRGDVIVLNMPSNVTFATDSDAVKADFYPVLVSVSRVLREFDQTLVNVNGHTDSDGDQGHNLDLSNRRAANVAQFLISQGNDIRRFRAIGFGETRPIASNASAEGKAANRRVEIEIDPRTAG